MNKRYVNCVGTELFLEPARPRAAATLPARGRAGSKAQGKTLVRLSLSQRERIKVRDSLAPNYFQGEMQRARPRAAATLQRDE